MDFTAILQGQVEQCCRCGFTSDHITEGAFQCLGDPDHVTFRARIRGTETTFSLELITIIEEWIEDPATAVIIKGLGLTLDQNCPIVIGSVNDPGCGSESETTNGGSSGSDNTGAIIGGVVAAIALIVLAVIVIVIVIAVLYFKSRRAELKITG